MRKPHLTGVFWFDRPQDAGIDPDFDEIDGELTLAQIRDPVLTLGDLWRPPGLGDPDGWYQRQRDRIAHNRSRLRRMMGRLKYVLELDVWRKRQRYEALSQRLAASASFKAQIARKRELLQKLSRRFLIGQLKDYPKFNFAGDLYNFGYNEKFSFTRQWSMTYRRKCNHCIPYNGHHTPNYWATGQEDCW